MDPEVADAEQDQEQQGDVIVQESPDVIDLVQSRIEDMKEIPKTEAVEYMYLRWNLLTKIEDLNAVPNLLYLELYDNQITKIENLDCIPKLEVLDISVNRLTKIEGLEKLANLKKLYLCSNKIQKIENLSHLKKLEELELGDNKIREIENLNGLDSLKKLFLGKNKIDKIKNLDGLKSLDLLSLQSNRLTKIENLDNLPQLKELHLSENGIIEISGLDNLVNLTILDLASNKISLIQNISQLQKLSEFWIDTNKISDWSTVENLKELKSLSTVYLEHNPIAESATYRRKVRLIVPWLENLDAIRIRSGSGVALRDERVKSSVPLIKAKSGGSLSKSSSKSVSRVSNVSAKQNKRQSGRLKNKGDKTAQEQGPQNRSGDVTKARQRDDVTRPDPTSKKQKPANSLSSVKNVLSIRKNATANEAVKNERSRTKTRSKFRIEPEGNRRTESKANELKSILKKESIYSDHSKLKPINPFNERATLKLASDTLRIDCCPPKIDFARNNLKNPFLKTTVKDKLLQTERANMKSDSAVTNRYIPFTDFRKLKIRDCDHNIEEALRAVDTFNYQLTKDYSSYSSVWKPRFAKKEGKKYFTKVMESPARTDSFKSPTTSTDTGVSPFPRSTRHNIGVGTRLQCHCKTNQSVSASRKITDSDSDFMRRFHDNPCEERKCAGARKNVFASTKSFRSSSVPKNPYRIEQNREY